MARGDVTIFDEWKLYLTSGVQDLDGDTINLGLITNAAAPTAGDPLPHWGGSGTTNHATNQVGTGGGYTGPVNVAGATSEAAGTVTFDLTSNPTFSQNASGATNIYWGIIYDDTDTNKRAIAFLDMGGPVSIVAGDVTITWNASGLFTLA